MIRPTLTSVMMLAVAWIATSSAYAEETGGGCSVRVENDKPVLSQACQDELDKAPNDAARADLLFRLAYVLNDNGKSVAALPLLDRVIALDPDNARYIGERGFTRGDLGYYFEAQEDLTKAIEILPSAASFYNERGWNRAQLGDFEGSLADYIKVNELGGSTPTQLFGQAEDLVWLGRVDEAEGMLSKFAGNHDFDERVSGLQKRIDRIRSFKPDGDPARQCQISEGKMEKVASERMVDVCTRAFLDTTDSKLKADFLTTRGTFRIAAEDGNDGQAEDMKVALGLDPTAVRYMNFGYAMLQVRHSWAARNAFTKALELGLPNDLQRAIVLAGRAQANYNLGEHNAAFADGRKSFETAPNEAALLVLGDLAFDKGDKDIAKSFWMGAWRLGDRTDELAKHLADVGVTDPASEPEPKD